MIDRIQYDDARRLEAMRSNQGSQRGWDFSPAKDERSLWGEITRPRSLVILAVIGITVALWWL